MASQEEKDKEPPSNGGQKDSRLKSKKPPSLVIAIPPPEATMSHDAAKQVGPTCITVNTMWRLAFRQRSLRAESVIWTTVLCKYRCWNQIRNVFEIFFFHSSHYVQTFFLIQMSLLFFFKSSIWFEIALYLYEIYKPTLYLYGHICVYVCVYNIVILFCNYTLFYNKWTKCNFQPLRSSLKKSESFQVTSSVSESTSGAEERGFLTRDRRSKLGRQTSLSQSIRR